MEKAVLALSPEAVALLRNIIDNIGNAPGNAPVLSIARPLIELDTEVRGAMEQLATARKA